MKSACLNLLKLCKSQKGKVSIPPLLIAAIAIAIIPIIATLFTGSREKVSTPTVAELPWCLPDPARTSYDNPCSADGSYDCAPDGKQTVCVNGKTQATGSCCAQPAPDTQTQPTALNEVIKAGCVFTLGYEVDGTIDQNLNREVYTKLNQLRDDILNGSTTGSDLAQIITSGMTAVEAKNRRKERFEKPDEHARKYAKWVNPYNRFLNGITTNFCFEDSNSLNNTLGTFFYEDNPQFSQFFEQLAPGDVSSPFTIYHGSSEGKKEYAAMMVYREK